MPLDSVEAKLNGPFQGGFPNAVYRDWWLPLFPTQCFTIGVFNPIFLAQCVSISTSF